MSKIILNKPVITEKSMSLTNQSKFSFSVALHATKSEIRNAVETLFGVKVLNIKTVAVSGKTKHTAKSRKMLKQPDWKKAIVQLTKGQTIDLFNTPEEDKKAKKTPKDKKK